PRMAHHLPACGAMSAQRLENDTSFGARFSKPLRSTISCSSINMDLSRSRLTRT
ncbi:hypothetical protein CPC16_002494, partial [Podila verticillata]